MTSLLRMIVYDIHTYMYSTLINLIFFGNTSCGFRWVLGGELLDLLHKARHIDVVMDEFRIVYHTISYKKS